MNSFRAVIYSIISLSLSGFCAYQIYSSRNIVPTTKIQITDNEIISRIIDTALKFVDGNRMAIAIILGIASMIFYTVTAFPLHEFFSNLPLGSIRKVDYSTSKKVGFTLLSSLSPAWVTGLYTAIHILLHYLASKNHIETDTLNAFVKWGLPSTVLLVSIILIALIIDIFINGGVWGLLIRTPLLLTENFCLSIILGLLFLLSVFLISISIFNLLIILALIIGIIITPKTKTKIEYVYRD